MNMKEVIIRSCIMLPCCIQFVFFASEISCSQGFRFWWLVELRESSLTQHWDRRRNTQGWQDDAMAVPTLKQRHQQLYESKTCTWSFFGGYMRLLKFCHSFFQIHIRSALSMFNQMISDVYLSIYPSIHQSISDGCAPAALGNLLLDPPDPQIIRTTQRLYSDFPNISRTCMFLFSDSFSFSLLFFSLLLLSSLWLFPSLRFIISPYCRKFDF